MNRIATIVLLIISCSVQAQESFNRFYVGVSYSPDVAFRFIIDNDGSGSFSEVIDLRNENEKPKFGMTSSLSAGFHIKKWLAMEIGVGYSNRGFTYGPIDLTFSNFEDPRFELNYMNNPLQAATVKYDYNFHYLDIPVAVAFKFQFGKFVLSPRVGATINVLTRSTISMVYAPSEAEAQRHTEDIEGDLNPVSVTPILGIGLGVALNDRITIMAAPKFKLGVVPIADGPISNLLWNAGIGVGFTYGFGAKHKEITQ